MKYVRECASMTHKPSKLRFKQIKSEYDYANQFSRARSDIRELIKGGQCPLDIMLIDRIIKLKSFSINC